MKDDRCRYAGSPLCTLEAQCNRGCETCPARCPDCKGCRHACRSCALCEVREIDFPGEVCECVSVAAHKDPPTPLDAAVERMTAELRSLWGIVLAADRLDDAETRYREAMIARRGDDALLSKLALAVFEARADYRKARAEVKA